MHPLRAILLFGSLSLGACTRSADRARTLHAAMDSTGWTAVRGYDRAAVAAVWSGIDSAVLVQLNDGRPPRAIQSWLDSVGGAKPSGSDIPDTPLTLIGPAGTPLGFRNTIARLGEGSGPDSTLVVIAGWSHFEGPGHLAVYARRGHRWTRTFAYSSDRKLWLRGRPLSADEGWILGMQIFVRADGAMARLVGWRVRNGRFTPLVMADTGEIEAGDFVPDSDGIAIESPDISWAFPNTVAAPRLERRRAYTLRGDTVMVQTTSLTPWLEVLAQVYQAHADRRPAVVHSLVTNDRVFRTLWSDPRSVVRASADSTAGRAIVELDGEPHLLVHIDRVASRWVITDAIERPTHVEQVSP